MHDTHEQRVTVNTTETEATAPARLAALQAVAELSTRQLMHFHWQKAERLLADLEHVIRDYGDDEETSEIYTHEADKIEASIPALREHLDHILAMAQESHARFRAELARAEAADTASPKLLESPNDGA